MRESDCGHDCADVCECVIAIIIIIDYQRGDEFKDDGEDIIKMPFHQRVDEIVQIIPIVGVTDAANLHAKFPLDSHDCEWGWWENSRCLWLDNT